MARESGGPDPCAPCPHIQIDPDVLSGAPAIAGTRIFADRPYDVTGQFWRPSQDPREWYAVFAADYGAHIPYDAFLAAWCWEAGRRYGEQHNRGDQRRRRLRTIEDACAWSARGRAEGIGAAVSYLRAAGQADLAAGLAAALGMTEGD